MLFKFENQALKDLKYWKYNNHILYKKIFSLLKDIQESPFVGIGKPEPLKENLSGWWSRRINREHRLIYKINKQEIIILSCRYHY
jgi:toxin YoeB